MVQNLSRSREGRVELDARGPIGVWSTRNTPMAAPALGGGHRLCLTACADRVQGSLRWTGAGGGPAAERTDGASAVGPVADRAMAITTTRQIRPIRISSFTAAIIG